LTPEDNWSDLLPRSALLHIVIGGIGMKVSIPTRQRARPLARIVAVELTPEQIAQVSGGSTGSGNTHVSWGTRNEVDWDTA